MTDKQWKNLKVGQIIRSAKSGVKRRILKHSRKSNTITLKKISYASHRLWSGQYTETTPPQYTVYCSCDKNMFKV